MLSWNEIYFYTRSGEHFHLWVQMNLGTDTGIVQHSKLDKKYEVFLRKVDSGMDCGILSQSWHLQALFQRIQWYKNRFLSKSLRCWVHSLVSVLGHKSDFSIQNILKRQRKTTLSCSEKNILFDSLFYSWKIIIIRKETLWLHTLTSRTKIYHWIELVVRDSTSIWDCHVSLRSKLLNLRISTEQIPLHWRNIDSQKRSNDFQAEHRNLQL